MSLLTQLMIVWGITAAALAGLLIYRTLLSMHEENQIFLDPAEAALERQSLQTTQKISRLDPIIKGVAVVSIALFLVIAALWIYRGLYGPPTF